METHDLSLLLKAHTPVIVIETHEEKRALNMVKDIAADNYMPVFRWSVSSGLQRLDLSLDEQTHLKQPDQVLQHILSARFKGIYILLDFHPYLKDPVNVRLLKEIAMQFDRAESKLVLISHQLQVPAEIQKLTADFQLQLPGDEDLVKLVREEAGRYVKTNNGRKVKAGAEMIDALVRNLRGLTYNDARRLIHNAIVDDGAITDSDIPEVMQAKYRLLNRDEVLSYEYETTKFSELAGMERLKRWLVQREKVFHGEVNMPGLDVPKGILLLGVQGCGKSVAAKAVAGVWGVPLLRLDFGRLYNKYVGETEKNLRNALKTAEVMAPCVLWVDELEKGIAVSDHDDGTSQRILGTLLTWLAENRQRVFLVSTANNIDMLPPELLRKGRMDEVFFVDLPDENTRRNIFNIHIDKRELDGSSLDINELARLTDGFSGAEIEQLVVSAIYSAHARDGKLAMEDLLEEVKLTRPLSVLMAEKISALRIWARDRTVPVD